MKNIFSRFRNKKKEDDLEDIDLPDDDEMPEPIPYRIGTVVRCVPSPTAEGKPEEEKVYITTVEIDGSEYRAAMQQRFEENQKVVATTVGNIALINPQKTEKL